MSAQSNPIEVFYSSAYIDEPLCSKLEKHLSLLRHEGLITLWHRRQVIPGMDWRTVVDHHLDTASIILLLISSDFLDSDYCYGGEVQRAMQRHEAGEARVIPVLLRPVDWQSAPFGKLKALPSNGKPITQWRNRDEAFSDVAQGIRLALEDVQWFSVSTPPTQLPDVWNVPYPRNPFFTGQESTLIRLADALKGSRSATLSQPQAINGLGGIGKTQIATEYAYQHHQDYQAVLWTLADTREALVSGYSAIARLLHLREKDEQDQRIIVEAVRRWLKTHTEWLLILDSADELEIVGEFIPPVFGGHILITTRAQATGKLARRIEVLSMPQDIGVLFLLRRATFLPLDASLEDANPSDIFTAREVTVELGGLPLALDQAGAYIEETLCSLSEYLHLYHMRRAEMLKRRGGSASDYPQSVATTWSLSFEKVEQRCPAAGDLLRLCAYLAPDVIPERIITQGAPHLGPLLAHASTDRFLLGQAIEVLRAYSLIQRDLRTQALSVHRLVQAVLRNSIEAVADKEWKLRVVQAVDASSPDIKDITQWNTCEQWLPHALLCATWIVQEDMRIPEALRILNHAGIYLDDHARYAEAEPLYWHTLVICEKQLGSHHSDTVKSLNNLAYLYTLQGKYTEAEPLYLRALAVCEEQLNPHHTDLVGSMSNLAVLYQTQGKYTKAEPLYLRALAICEKQLGSHHPNTAKSLNNLAHLYNVQGRYTEAEPFLRRALVIYEEQLGPHHPDTAMSLNNLAYLYNTQGKYTEAESLHRRALAIYEEQLGPHHPNTAKSLNNLAALYYAQKKYAEAELLYQRALAIYEEQLGPHHPDLARSLNNLAMLYNTQGRYTEAEPLYQRALAIYEEQLGPHHLDTAKLLYTMATLYYAQGKHAEAEPFLRRALAIYEQVEGADHPDTRIIRGNYADLLGQLEADGT